jgi:prevent-host-death family protein
MKTASISEAKARLSALIALARNGETIVITDRGVPVAHLTSALERPPDMSQSEFDKARIARLERAGVLSRPKGPPIDPEELRKRLLRGDPPAGAVDALLEERRSGR